VVLILPGTRHATSRVFEHWSPDAVGAAAGGLAEAVEALASGDPARIRAAHHNALLGAALDAYPGFGAFHDMVTDRLGRRPALSGSGSTLYDVPDRGETDEVVARLEGIPARVLALAI
jgi:4-diphosphocytidyl-2C-methyl-D-erythritol kinase